ncbi:hypothetical protein N1F78_10460 [Seonamhaeicola sp. MEBiC1930]|uniref:hypothetical protein n=1 Tax=Seonamhaeicola sp. MEBiC01930 TaxID=2976768 RepID=UPI003255EF35
MKKNKLHNIEESGFKVPDGYFDTLEDNIMSELKLKELTNSSGFKAPNNYFDTLEDVIINNISKETEPKVIQLFSKKRLIYFSGIAATILLLLTLNFNTKTEEELDYQTVENYILDENISSYEIASLLDENDLAEELFIENGIDEDVIEDYILNNLDVEDLY